MNRILVIDDDIEVCKQIKYNLQSNMTQVYYAQSVREALQHFHQYNYALVIMDINLSETDGLELLETLRRSKTVPIMVISSKCATTDKVQAFNAGADDYLSKPYDMDECFVRAKSLMRRYIELGGADSRCYTLAFGADLIIEPQYRRVTLRGERLELTRKEFDMLIYLATNAGLVLTREQIYEHVWGSDSFHNIDDTVRFHLYTLRKKMESSGQKDYIKNIWGVGYQFSSDDENY